jgi:hypothetical protein
LTPEDAGAEGPQEWEIAGRAFGEGSRNQLHTESLKGDGCCLDFILLAWRSFKRGRNGF